ncbi:MAG: insulinase family protein, partial [Chloroflexi bacterium]|nr:insulinase family protein [Chloroflexota bacterium]
EIIVDEIRSYRDDPGQYVFNVFDEALFGDSPLGWEIAGDEASVRGLPTEEIRTFWRRMYQPANVIVAVAGDLEHATVVDLVASAFGQGNGVVGDYAPAPKLPNGERLTVVERQTAQAYLCLGVPALPRDHADTWTLELLNTVLGDGSSSRLFLTIREDAGLAYDVHSFQTDYSDCGTLQVYAGVDPGAVQPTVRAVLVELARLRDEAVPPDQLARARAYARGHMELRLEETRHLAAWLGVQEALHDRVLSLDEAISALDAVTADDIQRLAQQLFRDELLTMAVVAPPGGLPALDKALRLP